MKKLKIALIGNPNCGKTTFFNKLTKSKHKIANYPGVTVERKEGFFKVGDTEVSVIDLPGTYSLNFTSEEEGIAVDFILNEKPDLVVNIIDASNIERSLFLTTQLMELNAPLILVCNKVDLAKAHGVNIDFEKVSSLLETDVLTTVGSKGIGIDGLIKKIVQKKPLNKGIYLRFSDDIENAVEKITPFLNENVKTRYSALRLLTSECRFTEKNLLVSDDKIEIVENIISEVSEKRSKTLCELISEQRNKIIAKTVKDLCKFSPVEKKTFSDKLDFFVMNKYLGLPIFFMVMYLMFWFTFSFGVYPTHFLEMCFQKIGTFVLKLWPVESYFRSLVVDGIIGGVGSVLTYIPNILLLFIFTSILEESGYMVRAAFVTDRIMHKIGLHGKSFLPFIVGFGCTVPAVMSTRILENKRDKLTVILVLPLIACSTKFAVFTMLIPAFFSPALATKILFLLYFIGILLAVFLIKVLRKTAFKGENIPFIMEVPPYQIPSMKNIFIDTWEKAGVYVKKAGTFILAISIILWFLNVFPVNKKITSEYEKDLKNLKSQIVQKIDSFSYEKLSKELEKELDFSIKEKRGVDFFGNKEVNSFIKNNPQKQNEISHLQKDVNESLSELKKNHQATILENSYMGKIGRFLEPAFRPLGFDWKINTALLSALSAKEIFISQLGIIFNEEDGKVGFLQQKLSKAYTPLQGFCILLFLLISAPCLATIVMTRKETGSNKWALIQLFGLTLLAYLLTFGVFQIGSFF